jgi:hypothetical protein
MACIRRSFVVDLPPADAQAELLRVVVPALTRASPFDVDLERPGRIHLSDRAAEPPAFRGGDGLDLSLLRNTFPRRITIRVRAEARGSRIVVKGVMATETRDLLLYLLNADSLGAGQV